MENKVGITELSSAKKNDLMLSNITRLHQGSLVGTASNSFETLDMRIAKSRDELYSDPNIPIEWKLQNYKDDNAESNRRFDKVVNTCATLTFCTILARVIVSIFENKDAS